MAWKRNLLGHHRDLWRSIGGAADEQAFLGKAMGAGFYLFVKVWRDMHYDAVLDYKGDLFRIEVKGTSSNRVNLTRGGRAGKQINRTVPSRTRPITRQDCDFTAGVYSDGVNHDSVCYIIPVEVIEILSSRATKGNFGVSRNYLEGQFKEKWDLITGGKLGLTSAEVKAGFVTVSSQTRHSYLKRLNVSLPVPTVYKVPNSRIVLKDVADIEALLIWQNLGT